MHIDSMGEHIKRFITWAARHPNEWEVMCGVHRTPISEKDFDRIARMLWRDQFTEAYYILWHRYASENGITVFPKNLN